MIIRTLSLVKISAVILAIVTLIFIGQSFIEQDIPEISCENVNSTSENSADFCSASKETHSSQNPQGNCIEYDPNAKSILVRESLGALGNQMFAYTMLLAMKLKFGFRPFLTRRANKILSPYFAGLEMQVAEDVLCEFERVWASYEEDVKEQRLENVREVIQQHFGKDNELKRDERGRWIIPKELSQGFPYHEVSNSMSVFNLKRFRVKESSFPWEPFWRREINDLENPEMQTGKAFILFPHGYGPTQNESEFINGAPNLISSLEKSFVLRPEFVQAAQSTLSKIVDSQKEKSKNTSKNNKTEKSWTFVGIHSRRTDHLKYEADIGNVELKTSYFLKAMDMYRKEFENVMFVYISDDVEWGRKNLAGRNKMGDLYFAGDGKPMESSSVGHDLALMSLCNHTIVSYGTFSFWVSFLAGGSTITPYHFPEYRSDSVSLTYFGLHPLEHPLPRLHASYFILTAC